MQSKNYTLHFTRTFADGSSEEDLVALGNNQETANEWLQWFAVGKPGYKSGTAGTRKVARVAGRSFVVSAATLVEKTFDLVVQSC